MKKFLSLSIFLTLALVIAAACQTASTAKYEADNKAAPTPETKTEEPPRISLADAKKDFDAGKAIFVDTRAAESFKLEHIKGAINIPAGEFETRYAELPKDKKIIAYCS